MLYADDPASFTDQQVGEGVLSVSSLNRLAKSLLETNFPAVVVAGEISNLATPASGHWYLTLKDKSSQIRCAMFVNRNRAVRFKPQNGNQVMVRGRLSIYEGRGDYQLIVDSMEEAGDGALRRAYEELKAKLQQEGLFESAAKQQVLSNYQHIGVVTSATGAAIHDILSVFARRFPATRITLFPVAVQGTNAADEIVNAIELANRHRQKLKLQALIIGRGGGSLEDLQAFNEERLARAIFASELPVTSAVGHEIDFSIADFVADLRAPTPSAAAELMSPSQQEYRASLDAYLTQFKQIAEAKIRQGQQQLDWLLKQLKHPDRRLQEHAQYLDRLEDRMQRAIGNRIALHSSVLAQLNRGLLASSPLQKIRQSGLLLDASMLRLKRSLQTFMEASKARLGELSRSLNAVSPLNTLARGYSITYDESAKVIHSSVDVTVGSKITTRLHRGRITSTVNKVSQ